MDASSMKHCSVDELGAFSKDVEGQMLRVNALLVVNTILTGVILGIGGYGHRYRHHPLPRLIFLGATTLFLPIISYVVSTLSNQYIISVLSRNKIMISGICSPQGHVFLVLVWTGLVQIVGISTSTIVAVEPREHRSIAPPVVLLVQAVWTFYLAVYTAGGGGQERFYLSEFWSNVETARGLILFLLFGLIFAKTIFNYYSFYEVKRSLALGNNPRFIVRYMEKLQGTSQQHVDENIPPPLIVMGEDVVHRKNQPHGYSIKWIMSGQGDRTKMNNDGLVTLDRVWQADDMILRSIPQGQQLKDLCFSFALFKLLRCRFARYKVAEAEFVVARNFFCHVLLTGTGDAERVIGIIANELGFLHDLYYSSQPISYSKCWLPVLGILLSLLSIAFCFGLLTLRTILGVAKSSMWQIQCQVACEVNSAPHSQGFGSLLFDLVPVFSLLAIVILAEARAVICFICSDWTKVSIICRYLNEASWQKSPSMRKWIGRLLQCRCKLVKPWVDKMNQCSVLVLPTRKTSPMVLLRRLVGPTLSEQTKNVKVPGAVKAAIIDKLRKSQESLNNGVISLRRRVLVGDDLFWECSGNGIADTLLVWHIATTIIEVRHPQEPQSEVDQQYKITAIHLSRYCAYLVIYSPELLLDDDKWCKTLYKAVKKDAKRVHTLASPCEVPSTPEAEFRQLVDLLTKKSEHEVLKNGGRIGKELASQGEEIVWKRLAEFWLEIILYIAAPSDHLDGHAEAVARGGELITLLWALLTHAGIVRRAEDATASLVLHHPTPPASLSPPHSQGRAPCTHAPASTPQPAAPSSPQTCASAAAQRCEGGEEIGQEMVGCGEAKSSVPMDEEASSMTS